MQVIIVDDEPVSLTALKQLVERLPDCDAECYTQAPAALDWCRRNDPDLVIVGYIMPDLNGIEFTEQFRALPGKADTPVLMVTATMDREVRNRAFERGVNDFLNKPYDAVELQARVSNMLVLRSRQKNLGTRGAFVAPDTGRRPTPAPREAREPDSSLLDIDMTLKRLAGDETLFGQVARVFVRTVPQLLSALSTALAADDLDRAYAEAHSLKGAVAVFEAPEVLSAIVDVEKEAIAYRAAAAAAAFAKAEVLIERLAHELSARVQPGAAA